jgi:hypothetical protein
MKIDLGLFISSSTRSLLHNGVSTNPEWEWWSESLVPREQTENLVGAAVLEMQWCLNKKKSVCSCILSFDKTTVQLKGTENSVGLSVPHNSLYSDMQPTRYCVTWGKGGGGGSKEQLCPCNMFGIIYTARSAKAANSSVGLFVLSIRIWFASRIRFLCTIH